MGDIDDLLDRADEWLADYRANDPEHNNDVLVRYLSDALRAERRVGYACSTCCDEGWLTDATPCDCELGQRFDYFQRRADRAEAALADVEAARLKSHREANEWCAKTLKAEAALAEREERIRWWEEEFGKESGQHLAVKRELAEARGLADAGLALIQFIRSKPDFHLPWRCPYMEALDNAARAYLDRTRPEWNWDGKLPPGAAPAQAPIAMWEDTGVTMDVGDLNAPTPEPRCTCPDGGAWRWKPQDHDRDCPARRGAP